MTKEGGEGKYGWGESHKEKRALALRAMAELAGLTLKVGPISVVWAVTARALGADMEKITERLIKAGKDELDVYDLGVALASLDQAFRPGVKKNKDDGE